MADFFPSCFACAQCSLLVAEQRSSEPAPPLVRQDTLVALEEDVTNNTKSLQLLDKQLLERLSNSQAWW